jgi:uncharacterized protein YbjT (DUF2867 family)
MKVLILGATGGTGREIVREAQAQGHAVAALVRSTERAQDLSGAHLVVGDARDEAALSRALEGCEGVISALGTGISPFRRVTLLSTATKALIAAMRAHGTKRLVCITGMGAGDSRGHGGFLYDRLIQPLLLRKVYEDKDRQEALVRDSGLEWVLVRPTVLNDKPGTGRIRTLTNLSGFHGGTIPRRDVAHFVVGQITGNDWLRQAPLITS